MRPPQHYGDNIYTQVRAKYHESFHDALSTEYHAGFTILSQHEKKIAFPKEAIENVLKIIAYYFVMYVFRPKYILEK